MTKYSVRHTLVCGRAKIIAGRSPHGPVGDNTKPIFRGSFSGCITVLTMVADENYPNSRRIGLRQVGRMRIRTHNHLRDTRLQSNQMRLPQLRASPRLIATPAPWSRHHRITISTCCIAPAAPPGSQRHLFRRAPIRYVFSRISGRLSSARSRSAKTTRRPAAGCISFGLGDQLVILLLTADALT
jgi:hypothetical protein